MQLMRRDYCRLTTKNEQENKQGLIAHQIGRSTPAAAAAAEAATRCQSWTPSISDCQGEMFTDTNSVKDRVDLLYMDKELQ